MTSPHCERKGLSPQLIEEDGRWMSLSIRLARRGQGRVAPNPSVGCVLVRGNRLVARGWTQPGGRPHAEVVALEQAGKCAAGSTAYISLEPCAHFGRTPPCADALIAAGVIRVVVALEDPDPRVDGRGLERLRAAGISVSCGVLQQEASLGLQGFLGRVRDGRPRVTLKIATTIDSRIATSHGESQWITGAPARRMVHLMRAQHDVVLTGVGTIQADDPMLNCRLIGLEERSPTRVVLDSALVTSPTSALARSSSDIKSMIFTTEAASTEAENALAARGVNILRVAANQDGSVSLDAVLQCLSKCGYTSVLVESGGQLATSFMALGLVDRLVWFRAPIVIGGDGRAALESMGVFILDVAPRFQRVDVRMIGEDMVETYERRP